MQGLIIYLQRLFVIFLFSLVNIHALPLQAQKVEWKKFLISDVSASEPIDCSDPQFSESSKCKTATMKEKDKKSGIKFVTASMWISMITLIAAIFVAWLTLFYCKPTGSCGWGTKLAALGGLAFLAGEVVSIIKFQKFHLKKEVEFSPILFRKHAEDCNNGLTENVPTDSAGNSICDQRTAIQAQRDSYQAMLEAVQIKMGLYIAGEVVYGLAAIIEFARAIKDKIAAKKRKADTEAVIPNARAESKAKNANNPAGAAETEARLAAMEIEIKALSAKVELLEAQLETPAPTALPSEESAREHAIAFGSLTSLLHRNSTFLMLNAPGSYSYYRLSLDAYASQFFCPEHYVLANPYGTPLMTGQCSRAYVRQIPKGLRGSIDSGTPEGQFAVFISNLLEIIFKSAFAGKEERQERREERKTRIKGPKVMQWVALIGGIGAGTLMALIKKSDDAIERIFSKTNLRGVWFLMVAGLAAINIVLLSQAKKKIQNRIAQLDKLLDSTGPAVPDPITTGDVDIDYAGLANFLDGQKDDAPTELPETFPCPYGGDGKGSCNPPFDGNEMSLQTLGLGSLAGLAGSANALGKDMLGKKSIGGNTLGAAGDLVRKAAAFKKFRNNFLKKFKGQTGTDAAALADDMNANMAKQIQGELNRLGKSASSILGAGGLSDDLKPSEEEVEKAMEKIEKQDPVFATANPGGTGDFSFDFDQGDNHEMELDALADETVGGLDVTSDDINSNSNGNIFSLITSRYLKSAYPRLFEEHSTPQESSNREVSP